MLVLVFTVLQLMIDLAVQIPMVTAGLTLTQGGLTPMVQTPSLTKLVSGSTKMGMAMATIQAV